MININLLDKIENLRTTVEPATRTPSQIARKQKFILLGALLLLLGSSVGYGFWFFGLYKPIKMIVIEQLTMAEPEPAPKIMEPEKGEAINHKVELSVPVQEEAAVDVPEVAAKIDKTEIKPIISRPVAKDASALKAALPGSGWALRFAVCLYKKSCDEVVRKLKKLKIKAYVTKGRAPILTHRVIIGPWQTIASAKLARSKLKKVMVESSLFSSGKKRYLSSEPLPNLDYAEKILVKVRALGYRAKKKSVKEPQKIYKVYQGSYKTKQLAGMRLKKYTGMGIDCILEKHI